MIPREIAETRKDEDKQRDYSSGGADDSQERVQRRGRQQRQVPTADSSSDGGPRVRETRANSTGWRKPARHEGEELCWRAAADGRAQEESPEQRHGQARAQEERQD
jgi:hypothetical protein